MRNTFYGDLAGRFEGSGLRLFLRGLPMWIAVVAPLAVTVGAFIEVVDWKALADALSAGGDDVMSRIEGTNPGLAGVVVFAMLMAGAAVTAAALLYPAFQALMLRWWSSGLRFGEIEMRSTLRTRQVYGAYMRFLWYAILFSIVMADHRRSGAAGGRPAGIAGERAGQRRRRNRGDRHPAGRLCDRGARLLDHLSRDGHALALAVGHGIAAIVRSFGARPGQGHRARQARRWARAWPMRSMWAGIDAHDDLRRRNLFRRQDQRAPRRDGDARRHPACKSPAPTDGCWRNGPMTRSKAWPRPTMCCASAAAAARCSSAWKFSIPLCRRHRRARGLCRPHRHAATPPAHQRHRLERGGDRVAAAGRLFRRAGDCRAAGAAAAGGDRSQAGRCGRHAGARHSRHPQEPAPRSNAATPTAEKPGRAALDKTGAPAGSRGRACRRRCAPSWCAGPRPMPWRCRAGRFTCSAA